jgi:hypothetical protein
MENVTGLLTSERGRFFNRVLSDLAEIGYDAEWDIIPASSLGAPHRRERVWLLSYPKGERHIHEQSKIDSKLNTKQSVSNDISEIDNDNDRHTTNLRSNLQTNESLNFHIDDHSMLLSCYANRSSCYLKTNSFSKCQQDCLLAIEIIEYDINQDMFKSSYIYTNTAVLRLYLILYLRLGLCQCQINMYDDAVLIFQSLFHVVSNMKNISSNKTTSINDSNVNNMIVNGESIKSISKFGIIHCWNKVEFHNFDITRQTTLISSFQLDSIQQDLKMLHLIILLLLLIFLFLQ